MLEERLERDIRSHLQNVFHVYMKHYDGEVMIHNQFPYHVDIIYKNRKTQSEIRVTNIVYDIYQKAYTIGNISMIQQDEQQEKLDELKKTYNRAQKVAVGTKRG